VLYNRFRNFTNEAEKLEQAESHLVQSRFGGVVPSSLHKKKEVCPSGSSNFNCDYGG